MPSTKIVTTVTIDAHVLDRLVDLVQTHHDDVQSGNVIVDQPADFEIADMKQLLADLRNADS